jgi:glycosyltransferase involved in cell wall biosynthesis
MAVSIVTPTLNSAGYLPDALASVANQRYPTIEHVVVDGGSTDGTGGLLETAGPHVRWVSEPDRGQSDALAKGLAMAGGDIIGWLNADDFYEPGALAAVAGYLGSHPDVDVLYGDCHYLYQDRLPVATRLVRARPFDLDDLLNRGCYIPQPTTFFRRRALDRVSPDPSLHFAMDYELWLQLAAAGRRFAYLPTTLACFRITRESKSGADVSNFWSETRRVSRRYGGRRFNQMLAYHWKLRLASALPWPYHLVARLAGRRGPE